MKKKVSILTFQESHNYGALLQAFALQTVLQEFQCDTEIINYHSKEKEILYKGKFNKKESIFTNVNNVLSFGFRNRRNRVTKEFRENKLNITKEIYLEDKQLEEYASKRDYIICGSDQIWNYNSINHDTRFFLDFVDDNKKIAYAPSFGVSELPINEREFYLRNLKNFNHLSVRESSGAKIIEDLLGLKVPVVLDPCLLLHINHWNNLIINCKKIKFPYIFLYYIKYSNEIVKFAKKISKMTGLPVIISARTIRDLKDGFKDCNMKVDEFVNTIKNAEYIITNSFHGTVFSILFHKRFISFLDKRKNDNTSSRIFNLLKKFELETQIFDNSSNQNYLFKDWNYKNVDLLLNEERKKSICYLEDSLKIER